MESNIISFLSGSRFHFVVIESNRVKCLEKSIINALVINNFIIFFLTALWLWFHQNITLSCEKKATKLWLLFMAIFPSSPFIQAMSGV